MAQEYKNENGYKYVISIVCIVLAALIYFVNRNDYIHTSLFAKDTVHDIKIETNRVDIDWLKKDINSKLDKLLTP